MDIPTRINALWRGGYGVWLGVAESEAVLNGNYAPLDAVNALEPAPAAVFVKFGGDWGGMWGDIGRYSDLYNYAPNVIPYLYCLPQHAALYPTLAGSLYRAGFPMVVADVEFEFDGAEAQLANMLDLWDVESNLMGLCGLAWFDGYAHYEQFGNVVNGRNLLYLPMAYVGDLTRPPQLPFATDPGFENTQVNHMRAWLKHVVPDCYMSVILDSASVGNGDALAFMQDGLSGSFWHFNDLDASAWSHLGHPQPQENVLSFPTSEIEEANTNIGQSLAWTDEMDTNLSQSDTWLADLATRAKDVPDVLNIVTSTRSAVQRVRDILPPLRDALHRARYLTKGE